MAAAPDQSLPDQYATWADLKAAYRFLNNPKVTPAELQRTHREQVRAECASHARILAIQDGSELDLSRHRSVTGLGFVGNGFGQGLLQQSTLAVTTDGQLLGVLHQIWWKGTLTANRSRLGTPKRVRTPEGETRRERQARPKESDLWSESIHAVAGLGLTPRVIHVADRGGDNLDTLHTAHETNSGFLVRARHDRHVRGTPIPARRDAPGLRPPMTTVSGCGPSCSVSQWPARETCVFRGDRPRRDKGTPTAD